MIRYLKEIKADAPSRFAILEPFANRFDARAVLPAKEDCVRFLDALGVKAPKGKTRGSLGKEILEALYPLSLNDLPDKLEEAGEISEKSRSGGYGILTDYLMRRDK